MNSFGAEKFTRYVSEYLVNHYNLHDHRGDKQYQSWEKDYFYDRRHVFEKSTLFFRIVNDLSDNNRDAHLYISNCDLGELEEKALLKLGVVSDCRGEALSVCVENGVARKCERINCNSDYPWPYATLYNLRNRDKPNLERDKVLSR